MKKIRIFFIFSIIFIILHSAKCDDVEAEEDAGHIQYTSKPTNDEKSILI
jgi:hypothetical protein